MALMTVIKARKPKQIAKVFSTDDVGNLIKQVAAQLVEGEARVVEVNAALDLKNLLQLVTARSDLVLMPGAICGAVQGDTIQLITERLLAHKLGVSLDNVPGGVVEIDGVKYAARVKRGVTPPKWVLLDADNPEGMPPEQMGWDIQTRLEYLEPLIPGLSTCERVELLSSSSRVHETSAQPGQASHAFIRVSDPEKVELLREFLRVEMQLHNLCFASPRYSRTDGTVIGNEPRTVIDLAVFVLGRLVFTAQPILNAEGYVVADAGVRIVNTGGGSLDLTWLKLPDTYRLAALQQKTGRDVRFSTTGALAVTDVGTLTLATPIEIKGTVDTLSAVVEGMKPGQKIRCETPFRASSSEAAFIKLGEDGVPFLHDVGTSTTYCLSFGERLKVTCVQDSALPVLFPGTNSLLSIAGPGAINAIKMSYNDLIGDRSTLVYGKGRPLGNLANIAALFQQSREWDGCFAYDELNDEITLIAPCPGSRAPKASFKPRPLKDTDFAAAQVWLQRNGFPLIAKQVVFDAIMLAAEDCVISPVRHYLEELEQKISWSPDTHELRLHRLFEIYFGSKADPSVPAAHPTYLKEVGRRFMVAAVARAMRPGCKVDTMLVLEGIQGGKKSSGIEILCGNQHFSDSLPNVGTKDASDHIRGKWFIEIGELAAMGKAEVEATKAFISRREERYRRPYDRAETRYKRRCVFVGTTNQDTYLRDETGNRRFWPVRVGMVDLDALERDRDLLWAEAVYWFRQGKPWHLTGEALHISEAAQESRVSEDIWQADIAKHLEGTEEASLQEVARAVGLDRARISRTEQNRLSACLKALGFVPNGKFTSGQDRNAVRYVRQKTEIA
ncbi:MAG: VapE domain-containing protein [Rhodobacterales bacterium]